MRSMGPGPFSCVTFVLLVKAQSVWINYRVLIGEEPGSDLEAASQGAGPDAHRTSTRTSYPKIYRRQFPCLYPCVHPSRSRVKESREMVSPARKAIARYDPER